ncbi:hypothetical protein [Microbacterium sp. UBA3394]|uniref:hypothetical protein n=1 Tax=Microbacterium sp. UBA3394 TaxID=1946945 RepID=UPI00257CE2CC|nr:hypothetical protein [Microbacterium sp. UBA3394]
MSDILGEQFVLDDGVVRVPRAVAEPAVSGDSRIEAGRCPKVIVHNSSRSRASPTESTARARGCSGREEF